MIKVLFIHHSTGANLIREGQLRVKQITPNIEFWDHSYNLYKTIPAFLGKYNYRTGLSDQHGQMTGQDYNINLSNNSPKEYAEIFSRDAEDPTLKSILQYDVIAFKNCFPTTEIKTDQQFQEDQQYYEIIRDSLAKYNDKKFILFTPPPLRSESTKPEYANRAKILVNWLKSKDFLKGVKNISIFDFFGLLTDEKGMLKKKYTRLIPFDSHPNKMANQEIAKIFAAYLARLCEEGRSLDPTWQS